MAHRFHFLEFFIYFCRVFHLLFDLKKKLFGILKIILPLAFGIYICWYFWNSYSAEERQTFMGVFRESNYFVVLLSVLIGLLSHISRAMRWKYMLQALGYNPSLMNTYNAVMIAYIANIVVPRMGEATRAGVLKGTDGVPFDKGFGTIVAERIIDVICLVLVSGLAMLVNIDNMTDMIGLAEQLSSSSDGAGDNGGGWIKYIIFGVIGLGVLAAMVLYIAHEGIRNRIKSFVGGFADGLKTVYTLDKKWAYLFHTAVIWGCYVLGFWVIFYAWEGTSNMPFDVILSAFIAGTIGFIVMQGGIGTYQVLVATVLTFFTAPEFFLEQKAFLPEHFGFATLIWSSQTLLIVALGLLSIAMVNKRKPSALQNEFQVDQ